MCVCESTWEERGGEDDDEDDEILTLSVLDGL